METLLEHLTLNSQPQSSANKTSNGQKSRNSTNISSEAQTDQNIAKVSSLSKTCALASICGHLSEIQYQQWFVKILTNLLLQMGYLAKTTMPRTSLFSTGLF